MLEWVWYVLKNLGLAIGAVFAAVGAAPWIFRVLPAQDWLRRRMFAPKLRIEFYELDRCYETSRSKYQNDAEPTWRKHLRLKVNNDDITTAERCRIVLYEIEEITRDGTSQVDYNTPLRLLWAKEGNGQDADGRDLHKGDPVYVDLLCTVDQPTGPYILIQDVKHTNILKFEKRYRFHIQGTAKNSPPVWFVCDVYTGSKWSDFLALPPETVKIVSRGENKRRRASSARPSQPS